MSAPTDSEILPTKKIRRARERARLIESMSEEGARVLGNEAEGRRARPLKLIGERRRAQIAAALADDPALQAIDKRVAGYVRRLDKLTRAIERLTAGRADLTSGHALGLRAASDNLTALLAQAQRARAERIDAIHRPPSLTARIGWEDGTAWRDQASLEEIQAAQDSLARQLALNAPHADEAPASPAWCIEQAAPESAGNFDPFSKPPAGRSFGTGANGATFGTPWTPGERSIVSVSNCLE